MNYPVYGRRPCEDLLDTLIAFYGKDLTSVSGKVIINGKGYCPVDSPVFNLIAQTLNYSASRWKSQ